MASYQQIEVPMAFFFNQVRARVVATGRRLVPKRWRRDIAVVPVVRFTEAIRKLGVERRIYTAGENKSMLDPFLPEKEEDVARLKSIQGEIHEMFIDLVRGSRGARLTGPEKTLFSGEYWTAKTALEYG